MKKVERDIQNISDPEVIRTRSHGKNKILFPAGFEPATLCVWSTRDNHYTKETIDSREQYFPNGLENITWESKTEKSFIPSGDRTQDLWIRSPTRYPLR